MSRRRVLDTNRLIKHWRWKLSQGGKELSDYTRDDVIEWARELIALDATSAIVTPVVVEFLCGTTNTHELDLSRAFLAEFTIIDGGQVKTEDWKEAERFASWVPRDTKPRHLGDVLIYAIAKRLGYTIFTSDLDFKRRSGSGS